jgi:hypothetical protein
MENPQNRIQIFRWPLCYLPQEELEIVLFFATLSWNVCRTAKKNGHVPFIIVILRFVIIWPATIPWNNSERWLLVLQGDSFWMKLCNGKLDSKLTFNSLKEIDVAFVKQQNEAILIDEKIVKARRKIQWLVVPFS